MKLATLSNSRIAFDKAAIMRRAYEIGRFALQLGRARREPASEINRTLSQSLTKAWAEAKREAAMLVDAARREVDARAMLAQRAREAAALAAQFGNDPDAIRFEIEREHCRQHFQTARIDALRGALATLGA